jgi:hypothetical protein
MTHEEFAALKAVLASFGTGVLVTGGLAYFVIKHFLSSYLTEKGKNLATREDIEDITRKVEEVRTQYTSLVEELKARHQLRLAAIDRRIQVHQEAFTLWRKVMTDVHTDKVGTVVTDCQSWWEQNCIYLEPNVREGFVTAYRAALDHRSLLRAHEQPNLIKSNWKKITDFPNILFQAIKLPALSELEEIELGVKKVVAR